MLFKSDRYFLAVLGKRLHISDILAPGALVMGHHELGSGKFRVSLRRRHGALGEVLSQGAEFKDLAW